MRVVYLGTPDFAVNPLVGLVEQCSDKVQIIAVVTNPDRPVGRKQVLTPCPVKVKAIEYGIPVYSYDKIRLEGVEDLKALNPDLMITCAFGQILSQEILDLPKYGVINIHASLLPKYRGASPIHYAILNGENKTGVTIMKTDIGIDTGDMLLIEKMPIEENDNFETVHDKLGAIGAHALLQTVAAMKSGTLTRTAQDGALATYAAKIEKADCLLDFSKDAKAVHDQIRGLSPIPLAFTHTADGKLLKVTASEIVSREGVTAPAGTVTSLAGGKITVACGKGEIALLTVLPEGKKRMAAADFINGRKIAVGDVLV